MTSQKLIEVVMPIREVSAESVRDKSNGASLAGW